MPATVWKGFLSFGLVSFPVRLFSAAPSALIHNNMLHRKRHTRMQEGALCATENKPVDRSDIVKGYETSKGEYVVVENEELKKIAPATATTMEVLQFVRDKEVDPIYFETSYFMAPEETVSKPYKLLYQALIASQYSAIAKVTMHGREHSVLIRTAPTGLLAHTLYYPNELRAANRPNVKLEQKASGKELALAKSLIEHLAGPFKPQQLHDAYRENVARLIEQKKKGQRITSTPHPRRAPVIDLMEALKRSISASGKPPISKASSSKAPRKRRAA